MKDLDRGSIKLDGLRVALIFPPYKESKDFVSLKEARQHLGKIPPLSLAFVASTLEKINCCVKIIDASCLSLTKEEVLKQILEFSPEFLGFTLATYQFHQTLDWIRYIKERINIPVIVGGVHMSALAKETLTHPEIDYGIVGEAEETLPDLLLTILEKRDLTEVKGICFCKDGQVILTEKRLPLKDLDEIPFPARHLLPNEKYYSLISKNRNFTAMTTSRGCPFHCIFCDNKTIFYRCRRPNKVVDEMEICKKDFGINEIDMFDAVFSINKRRVIAICEEIKRRKLKIFWSIRTRADLVDEETLGVLAGAGCIRIHYGIESGDPIILRKIKKEMDLDYIKKMVGLTKKKGIETFGYFMIGNPGETKKTIDATTRLMKSLSLDYVQIAPVFAPPNTELYEFLKIEFGKDYWSSYTLSQENKEILPRYGVSLTDQEIKQAVRKAYLGFYLRPTYVYKTLFKLRSWQDFNHSFLAVKDMFFSYLFNLYGKNL